MPHREDTFEAADGTRLFENLWLPACDTKAALLFVHGFTEHGGRYALLAKRFNRHGYAVHAPDLRGHGRSGGRRVFIRSLDEYLDDLQLSLSRIHRRHPGLPVFLLGHSMGGQLLALEAVKGNASLFAGPEMETDSAPVRGLVLSAAALRLDDALFPFLRRLAVWVGRWFPRLRLVRLGANGLSQDPRVVADFRADPLVFHGRFSTATAAAILLAIERIQANLEAVRLPFLALHGTGDIVTDPEGSRQLHARSASDDKTLKLYDGLYHDLFHEPLWEDVAADVVAWMDQRV